MPIRSVAFLRHLARPRAVPSLTTTAAGTAPPDTTASLRRKLKKVKAKADEYMELYNQFSREIFPFVVGVLLFDQLNHEVSIRELKKSVAMLKEEKEEKEASTTTASSSAMPASEPESEPTVANGTSCVGGST